MKAPHVLYRLHGFFCGRMFSREPPRQTLLERAGHGIVKLLLDLFHWWEMRRDFRRLEREAYELERLAAELRRVAERYGIDI